MRVGFAGTPPFAATALAAILDAGFLVVKVLTRPDRPRGRGLKLVPSAVKSLALERGLALFQPATLNDQAARAELAGAAPRQRGKSEAWTLMQPCRGVWRTCCGRINP